MSAPSASPFSTHGPTLQEQHSSRSGTSDAAIAVNPVIVLAGASAGGVGGEDHRTVWVGARSTDEALPSSARHRQMVYRAELLSRVREPAIPSLPLGDLTRIPFAIVLAQIGRQRSVVSRRARAAVRDMAA